MATEQMEYENFESYDENEMEQINYVYSYLAQVC